MCDRWGKGDSLQQIAQLFDRNHSSVSGILSVTGGMEGGNPTSKPTLKF